MTTQVRRRSPAAVLACLGALLAAAVVALSSPGVSHVGIPAWAHLGVRDVTAGLAVGAHLPEFSALPRSTHATARVLTPHGDGVDGPPVGWLVLLGLAVGVSAASGPRTLRLRAGIRQPGTRAPPSWF